MLFGFDNRSVKTFYAGWFYALSCLMNMTFTAFAMALVPFPGSVLALLCFAQSTGLAVEFLIRKGMLSVKDMQLRYLAKIFAGMTVIVSSAFLIDKDYMIYVPVVMGMLYLNINTLLRSSALHWAAVGFMSLSIVKALLLHHGTAREIAEYSSTAILLTGSGFLSFGLFRSNKRNYEENEQQASTLMAVSKMLNQLLVHDVNNALTSIFIVAAEKYRSDKPLFMEELEHRVGVVKDIIDSRIVDHQAAVDVGEVLDQMTALFAGPGVSIETEIVDTNRVVTSRNMLYSILRNLLENSMEAAQRADRPCRILIRKAGHSVLVEDDCGGFDVEGIRLGASSKSGVGEHGVFLSTITNPVIQVAFGVKVDLSRTRTGTRVEMVFERIEANLHPTQRF
jgi:signal transduction histidine kinase